MAVPIIKSKVVTQSPSSNATVSVTLPTIVDGDTVAIFIGRASNGLLVASAPMLAMGFTRVAGKAGSSSTSASGELWVASNMLASNSGATVTLTGTARNWRAVALALDACNPGQFVSTGSFAGSEWTWGTTGGNGAPVPGPINTPTEALVFAFIFDKTDVTRTISGAGWSEEDDGRSGNTGADVNITHVSLASKSVASAQTVTGPTITRDDAGATAGTYPLGQVAFVSASSNILPTVSVPAKHVVTEVGKPTSITAAGADVDGTIASYAWSQQTTNTTRSIPSLSGATTATVSFTPTVAGCFTLQVTATDDDGGTSPPVEVGVIVTPPAAKVRASGAWSPGKRVKTRVAGAWT